MEEIWPVVDHTSDLATWLDPSTGSIHLRVGTSGQVLDWSAEDAQVVGEALLDLAAKARALHET